MVRESDISLSNTVSGGPPFTPVLTTHTRTYSYTYMPHARACISYQMKATMLPTELLRATLLKKSHFDRSVDRSVGRAIHGAWIGARYVDNEGRAPGAAPRGCASGLRLGAAPRGHASGPRLGPFLWTGPIGPGPKRELLLTQDGSPNLGGRREHANARMWPGHLDGCYVNWGQNGLGVQIELDSVH